MPQETKTDDVGFLPPAEQIKRNKESLLEKPAKEASITPEIQLTTDVKPPAEQIAENKSQAIGESELLPPSQQIQANKASLLKPKVEETNSLPQRIQKFDPENPDYFVQDYIKNLDSGKSIYEAHKSNPKIKWGIKQSMAMKDYMDSPESGEEHPYINAAKSLGEFLLKGLKGAHEVVKDFTSPAIEPQTPSWIGQKQAVHPPNWLNAPVQQGASQEAIKRIVGDVATAGDVIAGVPLEVHQMVNKMQEGGVQLADDLGIGIHPTSGAITLTPKTKTEKLINFMTRNDIDADRAIVSAKVPSNVGKILYYAGEAPTDSGQQSYSQLLRTLIASYLVPSVKQRMIDNPSLTEGEATQQWIKDSDSWGTKSLQNLAQKIPSEKENVAAFTQLVVPEASSFGVGAGALGILGKGLSEMGRLSEVEALLPQAQAMTDTAQTAAKGGTFYVDAEGNITSAPSNSNVPRTKEQIREDWNNAEQLHSDNLDRIDSTNFERSGGRTFRFGPFNIPKPYVFSGGVSDAANAAADKLKQIATTGALATAIPATTGVIGAYRHRNEGPLGMAGGLLRGIEYGAAGELLGYGALKTAGKVSGVFSDIGKVGAGLQGSEGNAFKIAGNIPTSTDLTQKLFGGKIGNITAPTANWFANNLSQWAYQAIEAGTLATAMGIFNSTPYDELPSEAASGAAMVLVPHILSSAIHESPAARENRIARENASINQTKQQASPESLKNAANISDYRNVVNQQKQVVLDRQLELRRIAVDPKVKPEDLKKAQDAVKAEDDKLTQIMSANSQTRREYGRQNDLMWANLHRGLNGPLRSGQNNVGVEILTKDQILQKLVDNNKDFASTPQGMATLEHIASQDGCVINSAGGVEIPAGSDLAEELKKTPIMFDPSKTTAIINADASMRNAAFRGTGMVEQIGHEGGHLYSRTKEFQDANRQLLHDMFSTNTYNEDGSVAHEDVGYFSNQQMKDLLWNSYLKNRTDAEKKAWLSSKGLWDEKNDKFIDKAALEYYREEIIADMASNVMKSRTMSAGDGYLLKWAAINHSNNILARAIQGVLGVGGKDPFGPAYVSGAEFTPEMIAQTDRAMRQVEDYYGHIAPVIDAEPAVSITTKDMMKSRGLLKKYGITSGMFQTSVFGVVRNARGEVVAKVPLANPTTSEGMWVMDKSTGRPKQVKGYDQLPNELDSIPVPEGGTLEVSREVAMQPDGETPILLSASQQKKEQNARRNAILNALGITEIPENGVTWRGTLSPEQVENIKRLPEHIVPKAIKDVILQINESLVTGDGSRWIIDYSPTSGKKGKRKSLTMKPYDVVPIGIHFTKDGNFNFTAISATRLFSKIHAWGAEFPHILDMWGGSKAEFFNEFTTKYLKNWQEGKAGETGLDPDPKIAAMKRDIFNNFLNLKDKDTEPKNQNRFYLKKQKGDLGPEGRDRTIMSIRADHVSSIVPSNAPKIPVDYYKAKINAMPESGLPYEERPEEEPAPAPAQEERKPAAIDLGITAAHSRENAPFGATYVAPQAQAQAPQAPKTGISFMPASAEIREKGSKQQLEFFDRVLENSGIKDKPNTMAALDMFIHKYVDEKYGAYVYGGAPTKGELFPKIDPEKIKNYYQKAVRDATPEQAAEFPPDWLRIRNMSQAQFDASFGQDRVDQITQFRVNALAKSANYLLGEMKPPEQTELQKKIIEINDALAGGDIGLWEEKQAELEKLNGDTYENLRNQAFQGSYTPAEVAAILNASAKFRVNTRVSEDGEMTPVIQNISNGNEAVPNEISGETASKIAEYMRMGMASKDAYVKGLYDNMVARAKKRGVYTGWKKYDQSSDMGDAETLNADCAGTRWCTGGSVGTANSHLSGGDFYLYFDKGDPQIAIRTESGNIMEVRGRGEAQNITDPQYDAEAERFVLSAEGPNGGEAYLHDRNFRKMAVEILRTGVVPNDAYKHFNQFGKFIEPRPKQLDYGNGFEKEYTDAFRNAALDIILDEDGNLKTSLSYDDRDPDNNKYKTIGGDITRPQTIKLYDYKLHLPNLESVKGGIIVNSAGSLILPKLKSCDYIYAKNATDVDIKNLENCNSIQLDTASSLIAPKLQEISRVIHADEATQIDLRNLKKAGSIRLHQLVDKPKIIVLLNLEECPNIDINVGYGGSLNLPKLKKAEFVYIQTGSETIGKNYGGEVYVPKLEVPENIRINTEVLQSTKDVFMAKAQRMPRPEKFTWIDSETGKTYKMLSGADFADLSRAFRGEKIMTPMGVMTPEELLKIYEMDSQENRDKAMGMSFMPSRDGEERIKEATYTNPRTGEVSRGATHTIANPNAPQEATDRESPAYGFGTTAGRIVDRNEGFQIAQAAGQLKEPTTEEEKFHADRGVLHSGMYDPVKAGASDISFMPAAGESKKVPTQEELDAMKARLPKYRSQVIQSTKNKDRFKINIRDDKNEVVGFGTGEYDPTENRLNIENTMVYPDYRKKGYGEALYREIAKHAQSIGADALYGREVSDAAEKVREKLFPTTLERGEREDEKAMESAIQTGISFMPSSKLDEAHADLEKRYKEGDEKAYEEAQRLSDEKAKEKGYPIAYPLYRGVRKKLNASGVMQTQGGRATLSFTDVPEVAKLYTHDREMFGGIKLSETGSVKKVYLNLKNPLDLREYGTKVNLGEIIENYTNYDFRPNTEADPNTTFTIEDLQKLFVRLQKLEKSTQFESDIQASDNGGLFRLRNFGDVREAIEELIDDDDADLPEKIDNILQGIELDTYALADNQWFIKALKQRGYDGLIHKDTIEAGKEFFKEPSVAGKPIEEIKGIDVEDDYSHDTYRPFESSQIKLADPFTYDKEGKLIPLSQRFNQAKDDIRFMPYSPELPKTEDGKVDWEGFKTKTQEIAKPLAGLSFMPIDESGKEITPDFYHTTTTDFSKLKLKKGQTHFNVGIKDADGNTIIYKYDPSRLIEPQIQSIKLLSGKRVMILQADRHHTLGNDMGGPLHPWLQSNQVVVTAPDGKQYKAVWANLGRAQVTGAKNKAQLADDGWALVYAMEQDAHISNKKFSFDASDKIDDLVNQKKISKKHQDLLHVLFGLGEYREKKATESRNRSQKRNSLKKKGIDVGPAPKVEKTEEDANMFALGKAIASAKSANTRGNKQDALSKIDKAIERFQKEDWYKEMVKRGKSRSFRKESELLSFNGRKAAMDAIRGVPFIHSIDAQLKATEDYNGATSGSAVAAIRLSQDKNAFAVYFGKDPKEEAAMSPTEKLLRDQFRADPNFVEHPSYDWVMLSPADANNFIIDNPIHLDDLVPSYKNTSPSIQPYLKTKTQQQIRAMVVGTMHTDPKHPIMVP